jgi:hypothetical protein
MEKIVDTDQNTAGKNVTRHVLAHTAQQRYVFRTGFNIFFRIGTQHMPEQRRGLSAY